MNNPLYAWFAGPIGHLVDLSRIVRFTFRNPYSYTKFRQIISVARRTRARTLIETGTYKAVTTRRCLPYFEKIYTIELDHQLAEAASHALRRHPKCLVIEGDATKTVASLLDSRSIGDDLLFFLDGHFSGVGTAHGQQAEPALDVLEIIARHENRVAAIIIDDFRDFGTEAGWPSKSSLLGRLEQLFPSESFTLAVHLDQVLLMRK